MNKKQFLTSMVLGVSVASIASNAAQARPSKMEKCYGIVKATYNDCADTTGKHSCAGGATEDGSPHEWILLPKGTCQKIVGGKLEE